MTADPSGLFAGSGEMNLVRDYNFKGSLIDVLHKADVKFSLPARAIFVLHPLCDRVVAAQVHTPAADAPQKHFYIAFSVTVVGFGKFWAAESRFKYGDQTVFAFDSDPERLSSVFQIGLRPNAERNEVLVQQGLIFQGVCNTEIVHSALLFAHSGSFAAAASSQMTATSGWNCKIEPGISGLTGP